MRERLQEYALLAEIIAAVAVVISIVFVGIEVRQSNDLARTETLREGTQMYVDAYQSFQTEESTAFLRKGVNSYESLSQDEKGRFFYQIFRYVAAFDTIHNQYEAGLLREETYISIAGSYYALVGMPGVKILFAEATEYLPPYLTDPEANPLLPETERFLPLWPFLRE